MYGSLYCFFYFSLSCWEIHKWSAGTRYILKSNLHRDVEIMNLSIFSRSFESSITDPGCFSRIRIFSSRVHIKENKYLRNSKLSEVWSGLFIPDPDPDFLPIPDPGPGVKKAPVPGSRGQKGTGSRIRNTVWKLWFTYCLMIEVTRTRMFILLLINYLTYTCGHCETYYLLNCLLVYLPYMWIVVHPGAASGPTLRPYHRSPSSDGIFIFLSL